MKAVILAAGFGSRLLPHTKTMPKCLLRVRGHSILDYQISALRQNGIRDIAVVIGYCGDKIRKHLKIPVTFIENKDYATTNSSYSLYLARKSTQDGFIYLNSDLIFHPEMLQTLLRSKSKDAIVVTHKVDRQNDMHKAQIKQARILRIGKDLPTKACSADVIGPAKFSPQGAKQVMRIIETAIKSGERNNWCYTIFGDFARTNPFFAVENPGFFWTEIDRPSDLSKAERNMPKNFFEA